MIPEWVGAGWKAREGRGGSNGSESGEAEDYGTRRDCGVPFLINQKHEAGVLEAFLDK